LTGIISIRYYQDNNVNLSKYYYEQKTIKNYFTKGHTSFNAWHCKIFEKDGRMISCYGSEIREKMCYTFDEIENKKTLDSVH